MNRFPHLLMAVAVLPVLSLASCAYKYHLPRTAATASVVAQITMKVGEKQKVVSEQPFNGANGKEVVPPMAMFSSSNPEVVDLDLKSSMYQDAWIIAKKPGQATLSYRSEDGPDAVSMQTVVKVVP